MRVTNLRPTLGTQLDRQLGIVSRGQLIAAGVDDMTIYRYIRDGRWRRLLPGIVLVEPDSFGTEHRRICAALFVGEQAQLTGLCALHWYGFRAAPSTDKIHVLVPHEVHRRSTGFVVVQRTMTLDANERVTPNYRLTSPARAVVDAARALGTLRDVRAIVAEAVQSGQTTTVALDMEIRRAARSRTGLVRRALTEVVAGAMSAPEAELRELAAHSTVLPPILWNPTLTTLDGIVLPRPDGWIDEVGLAFEVDSAEYHADPDGWRRTLERHNELVKYNAEVLHFTPSQIRATPRKVLSDMEQAYRKRRAAGSRAEVIVVKKDARPGADG